MGHYRFIARNVGDTKMKGFLGLGKKKEAEIDMKDSKGGKYIIQHDQEACIGCGACAALTPEHWVMEDGGKAKLIGSVFNGQTQMFEKNIDESHYERNKMAAEGCPVNCIHIINNETGEKII